MLVHVAECDARAHSQRPVKAYVLVSHDGIPVKPGRSLLAGAEQGAGVGEKVAGDDARATIRADVNHFADEALRLVVDGAILAKRDRANHHIGFTVARHALAQGSALVAVMEHFQGLGDCGCIADDMHFALKKAHVNGLTGLCHDVVDGISLEWAHVGGG